MSNNYSPDADDQMPEKKSSQQLLLLLLLLLVILFAYLYFFTGLIKPRGEEPKPPAPVEALVKKPLPPRPEVKGAAANKPAAPPVAKTEEHKGGAAVQPQPAKAGAAGKEAAGAKAAAGAKEAPAAKTAAGGKEAPAARPAGSATAKPAAAAAQAKRAQPAAAAQAKAAAGAEKKTAAKAAVFGQATQKQAASEKAAAAGGKKPQAAAKPAAAYTLESSGDLAESEVAPVMAKLKQAGFTHVVRSKQVKGEPMHRLFLADFANRDEAMEELERLKLATSDAFMLKEGGRYAVYAGSYLREAKVASEQSRLQAKGVQLLVKSATAPVTVLKLRAGAYADQAGAERAAKALKRAGLAFKVVRLAKAQK